MKEREFPGLPGTRFTDIRWFDVIDSTNRYLLERAAEGAGDGLVAVADHQSEGRGRRGRMWDSKPGASLLLSVLFRPPAGVGPSLYPQALALAVVDACAAEAGFTASLKWPNDIVVGDRKLAGVLAEATTVGADTEALVVGCGLNLNWGDQMPDALKDAAVSADGLAGRPIDPAGMLTAILSALHVRLSRPAWIPAAYRSRCSTIGKPVRVERSDGALSGTAVDVTDGGSLVLETATGTENVSVGEVVHLRSA